MDEDRFDDLDDDLFPVCGPGQFGRRHTDEYGVTYVVDHLVGLGWVWVRPGVTPARAVTVPAADRAAGTVVVWTTAVWAPVVRWAQPGGAPAGAYGARVTTDPDRVTAGRFLTLEQVGDELAVSRAQVYAMVRDKTLLALKVGGRGKWRVERSELEAYIARLYEEARARPAVRVDDDEVPADE